MPVNEKSFFHCTCGLTYRLTSGNIWETTEPDVNRSRRRDQTHIIWFHICEQMKLIEHKTSSRARNRVHRGRAVTTHSRCDSWIEGDVCVHSVDGTRTYVTREICHIVRSHAWCGFNPGMNERLARYVTWAAEEESGTTMCITSTGPCRHTHTQTRRWRGNKSRETHLTCRAAWGK